MKKLYIALSALAATLTVTAQQLPNVSFNDWKEACDSSESFGGSMGFTGMRQRPGVEPAGWNGSNVNQHVLMDVAEPGFVLKVAGKGTDTSAVQLTNKKVGAFGIGDEAPAFLNFGTPWVYADINMAECDGGTYGGLDFTYMPDAVQLDYMRSDANDEVSTVVAYAWKGTFISNVGTKSNPEWTRENVDRAVMGRITPNEGSDGQLIASIDTTFSSTNGEWTTLVLPFEYVSDATPEKLNVIVCSGDYWNRDNLIADTQITVDNVKLVYYSQLAGLNLDGVALEGFAPDTYTYTVDAEMPAEITGTANGKNATVEVARDEAAATATITVSNVGEDLDGLTEHVYTLQFKAAEQGETTDVNYNGKLTIEMMGGMLTPEGGQDAKIVMAYGSNPNVCTVTLPNFTLDIGYGPMPLGDIVVENVTVAENAGTINYTGSVTGLELAGGEIVADVDMTGSETDNNLHMTINVVWEGIPIVCEFNGTRDTSAITNVAVDENAPVEMYNLRGVRVDGDQLPAGIYIRRQGNTVTKVLVK